MKKIGKFFLIILLSGIIFLVGFNYKDNRQPKSLYRVYLDKELIGTIQSKKELESYIKTKIERAVAKKPYINPPKLFMNVKITE
mgnify:CR=1 FL=1